MVSLSSLDECKNGFPDEQGQVHQPSPVVASPYTCERVALNHDELFFAFHAKLIGSDTASYCRGIKVYDNDHCDGSPRYFVPFHGDKLDVQDRCVHEDYFDNDVKWLGIQLDCEDEGEPKTAKKKEEEVAQPVAPKPVASQPAAPAPAQAAPQPAAGPLGIIPGIL